MKKQILMFLVAVMATAMSLKAQTVLIDEGFENGILSEVWTQEYVRGNLSWAVENVSDGLSYPSTVVEGQQRAYLRNTSGESMGSITRLVSKVMDLSPRYVYMPQLTFSYANPKWGADMDTLRVLYRTGTNARWKQLAEFTTASSSWQEVVLELPEVSTTYQIAFEGAENLGRGIVLDRVKVGSSPECTVPSNLYVSSRGASNVNIAWAASWDADRFELLVVKDTLIDPNNLDDVSDTLIAYHGLVDGSQQNYDLTLEENRFYYAYVRSICGDEISAWSSEAAPEGAYGFRVRKTLLVPFTEKFNYPSDQSQHPDWTWVNSISSGIAIPWVNSKVTSVTEKLKYSNDTTSALIFSGVKSNKVNVTAPIEAGKYALVATPALAGVPADGADEFSLSQCQVHFWSTVYTFVGRQYGRGIIVGVMDDPADITTFVPVDTVYVWGNKVYQENIVDLGSYTGEGLYVAFLSSFDRPNLFYIDNVTVENRPEVSKVTKISVNPRDTYATITWEGNAPSYNVLITNAEVADPSNPDTAAVVDMATVSGNSYLCNALEAYHGWSNHPYYVYVQAEGTEWSYRYPFVTLDTMATVPYTLGFDGKIERINLFGNDSKYQSLMTTNKFKGTKCLFMNKVAGTDAWITLPMVEDLDSVQVKFYLSGGSTANTYKKAHATIGVMTNPMDINTFIKVSSFTLTTDGYTMCYANFKNYSGPKDGVIAIVWDDVRAMTENTINYIDELRVEHVSECTPPENIELEIMSDSVTVSWTASQQNFWEVVIVKNSALTTAEKDKPFEEIRNLGKVAFADTLVWMGDQAQAPEFGIGGLKDKTDYVMYIRTVCSGDAAWWTELPFSTPCPNADFPFKETFDSYSASTAAAAQLPCWQMIDYLGTGYPYIYSANGGKTLELWTTGTTHRNVVIMPPIEGDLSSMLLSFETRSYSTGATSSSVLYVGTMGDIEDQSTFVPFDTIRNTGGSEFQSVRLLLSDYNLAYDNIAFSSGLSGSSDVLIDNVELKDATCIEAYNFRQTAEDAHSVDFAWDGLSTNDEWELRVLNKKVTLANAASGNYDTINVAIINDTLVTGRAFHVEELAPITTYYVYIRVMCGDSTWTLYEIQTACEKMDPNKPNKETFESYQGGTSYNANYQAQCWTVGNGGTTTSTSYIPFIYNSSTYANSGSNSYRLYGYDYSDYVPAYVVSPEIDCAHMKDLAVSFNMYASTSYSWLCGVMTDPHDLRTFVVLDSVKGTGESKQYIYDLSEYADTIPATARYFAWRTPYDATSYAYLDDVSIFKVTCPFTKPAISDLTAQSVRVGSGLRTDEEWLLLVTTTEMNPDSLSSPTYVVPESVKVFFDTIDVRSKRVTGLSEQTKYYVATATYCDSTVSQWNTLSFTTPCTALKPSALGTDGTITFSTAEGFVTGSGATRYLPCWTIGSKTPNLTASSSYIPYIETTSTYQHNGHNSLKLYDYVYGTTSNYVGAYAIMPELFVDTITKYQVNFWARGYNSSSYNSQVIVGIINDPSDLNTFVAVDTLDLNKTTWEPFSVGFENYQGDFLGNMGRNIMFLSNFGATNYAYITEISVTLIPSCRPLSSFEVDSVGESAAIVSWRGYQDSYRLLVADKVLTDAEKPTYHYLIDSIVTHSNRVLIENLNSTTSYFVYAQGICGEGDSTAISMQYASVRTTCPTTGGVPLPFYEDFLSYEENAVDPGCWIFRGSTWTKVKSVTAGDKTYHAIDLYTTSSGNNGYIVVPVVNGDLQNLQVSFEARTYGGGATSSATVYMGTMSDPEDPTTFVQAASFAIGGSEFQRFEVSLSEYDLPHDRLVFTSGLQAVSSSNDLYITNIGLSEVSTCHAPKLKEVATSAKSITISLTPAKPENTMWEVVVLSEEERTAITDIDAYLNAATKIEVDSTNRQAITISSLAPATNYYCFARTICDTAGTGTLSPWMKTPLKVTTRFYYENNYFFGFEKEGELWDRSTYSKSDNYYIHPALITGRDSLGAETTSYSYYPYSAENTAYMLYAHSGSGALTINASGIYHGGYVIFPEIEMAQRRSFEFKVRPTSISASTTKPTAATAAVLEVGTVDKGGDFSSYEPIALIRLDALDPEEKATEENKYLFRYYTLDLDSAVIADKQMVLHAPQQPDLTSTLYIDDVKMDREKDYSFVALDKITAGGSDAMIEWYNVGSPWNLEILDANGEPVIEYNNLTTTSLHVTGLSPRTRYTARLSAAEAEEDSEYETSSEMSFSTTCERLEPDDNGVFAWDFNDPNEWEQNSVLEGAASDTAYFMPSCFNVGITYPTARNGYQWLIQPKEYNYSAALGAYAERYVEVGRNDSYAMRVNTVGSYFNSYLVLPELNCGFDTMMIEFYGRCFANYDETYPTEVSRGKIIDVTYLSSVYSQSIVVGTLTDPTDFSTLQVIDTLTYRQTSLTKTDNVNNDPAGLRYWEKMQLPLTGAQGKYIVLFQPAQGLFFLDDLTVKPIGNTLFEPTNPYTSDITDNSATLSWTAQHPDLASVVVMIDAMGEEIIRDTVAGATYSATNLAPGASYQWYVYQIDGQNSSPASVMVGFATECVEIASGYTCGFELQDGWQEIPNNSAYKQALCWTYSDANKGRWVNATYDPYNQPNTDSYLYSRTDSFAVAMRGVYGSYQPYVALPAIDMNALDTLQLIFWMRPAYVQRGTGIIAQQFTGSDYAKSVIVGTMTDPNDAATFVPLDTVTYLGSLIATDVATEANNWFYQRVKVELAGATGPYVAIMTSFYEKGSTVRKSNNRMWIDDVEIMPVSDCKDPKNLTVDRVGATDVDFSWEGMTNGTYLLQVSTDPYFTNEAACIFNDTVYSEAYTVTGLAMRAEYAWRVKTVCSEYEESAYTTAPTFKTLRSPFYRETFDVAINSDWYLSSSKAENVVDTAAAMTKTDNTTGKFSRSTNDIGLEGNHYTAVGFNRSYHWLVSPSLYLPEDDSVHFSMDLALTACNTSYIPTANPVSESDMKDSYYFMIIVSEDDGETWKSENILAKWQNTNAAGKQLRDLSATGETVRYSLAKYAGKNIRVGLYCQADTAVSTGIAIHVDNLRFAYFDKEVQYETGCQYEDIQIGDIVIPGDEAEPGVHYFPSSTYATDAQAKAGVHDLVQSIEVEIFPAEETVYADTICENDVYSDENFQNKTLAGTYRIKILSSHMCDSTITLHLHVIPAAYGPDDVQELCQGETYTWHNKTYNRTGIYRDTTVSAAGCDSIETLVLSYRAPEDTIFDATTIEVKDLPFSYENEEYPYVAGQAPIYYAEGTAPGEYVDVVMVEGEYCARVLVHTLTIINPHQGLDRLLMGTDSPHKVIYRDKLYIICNGEWYNASGQKVQDPRL